MNSKLETMLQAEIRVIIQNFYMNLSEGAREGLISKGVRKFLLICKISHVYVL